jgi:hypothetical protein
VIAPIDIRVYGVKVDGNYLRDIDNPGEFRVNRSVNTETPDQERLGYAHRRKNK